MPEHQQTQKSTGSMQTSQKQTNSILQIPSSNPAPIIQRARINPKSLTLSDVLQLQCTIGNRAVGRLLSEIRNPSTLQQEPAQFKVIDKKEITEPGQLFQRLRLNSENEWERAAAKSLLADNVTYDLESDNKYKILETIQERINLARAIISIVNTGILSNEERLKRSIHSQQSIDPTTGKESKVSLSQAEIGDENNAKVVAGLLEHQAMSVRMEKYIEKRIVQGGILPKKARQVPEQFLDPHYFQPEELFSAFNIIKTDFNSKGDQSLNQLTLEQFIKKCETNSSLYNFLYKTVIMKVRVNKQSKSLFDRELEQRASLSAMFIGTPDSLMETNMQACDEMRLNEEMQGSREIRTSQSIPGSSLKYVLVPEHMKSFQPLFKENLKNEISILYVHGFHKVKVNFQGMTNLPQVSFDIESPDWAKELERILGEKKRIFSHVTRPLKQPSSQQLDLGFMKSKITEPLPLIDQLLADKLFGHKQASELFKVRSIK
jgi:hypothetical protein